MYQNYNYTSVFNNHYTLMVFTLACLCPENSACTYGNLMQTALRTMLKDPGFSVSTSGKAAQTCASDMLESLGAAENHTAEAAVQKIVSAIASCIGRHDKMWGLLHQARTSAKFIATWEELMILTLHKVASPIFYQYITDEIFKQLVKQQYKLPAKTTEACSLPPLDYQEQNAVRYAAGYIVRHLRQRLERGSHHLKEELVLCLEEMCDDTDDDCGASTDWTKQVNRGGLKVVNSKAYHFFLSVETRLRQFLRVSEAPNIGDGNKETLVEQISCDEDVLFFWTILAAEWEEEEQTLFPMVIEMWITIRGFSFSKSFLEMYKQANKTSVQKSKGLRKKLNK